MTIQKMLIDFKNHNEAKKQLETDIINNTKELIHQLEEKEYSFFLSTVTIMNNTLIIAFQTSVINFNNLEKLNNLIGMDGQIGVKRNSKRPIRLCYHIK